MMNAITFKKLGRPFYVSFYDNYSSFKRVIVNLTPIQSKLPVICFCVKGEQHLAVNLLVPDVHKKVTLI